MSDKSFVMASAHNVGIGAPDCFLSSILAARLCARVSSTSSQILSAVQLVADLQYSGSRYCRRTGDDDITPLTPVTTYCLCESNTAVSSSSTRRQPGPLR